MAGREVLRDLSLALALIAMVVKVVTELGADDDAIANRGEGIGEDGLAFAVAVSVGRVIEGDAEVEGPPEQINGKLVVFDTPPTGGDRPEAKADGGE